MCGEIFAVAFPVRGPQSMRCSHAIGWAYAPLLRVMGWRSRAITMRSAAITRDSSLFPLPYFADQNLTIAIPRAKANP